jgi:RNA recognition motif-containing protein
MSESKTLYLAGFDSNVTRKDIYDLFAKVTEVKDIYIPPETPTGIIRRFAMIKVLIKDQLQKYVSDLK